MTAEQNRRAGKAADNRIRWLRTSIAQVAAEAGVGETTLRALIRGDRWPTLETRRRLEAALDWPEGELLRRAVIDFETEVKDIPTRVLLAELARRCDSAGV